MTSNRSLSRLCVICGIEKPLSAFLYFTGMAGVHSDVCFSCQGKTAPHLNNNEESSGSGGSDLLRIGTKEKVFIEQEKKRIIETIEETQQEEKKKREELEEKIINEKETKQKLDKEHRTSFLDSKPRAELVGIKISTLARKNPLSAQPTLPITGETPATSRALEKIATSDPNDKAGEITDPNKAFLETPLNEIQRYPGLDFLKFKRWLGSGAAATPLMKKLESLYGKTAGKTDNPAQNTPEKKEDPLLSYPTNAWGRKK